MPPWVLLCVAAAGHPATLPAWAPQVPPDPAVAAQTQYLLEPDRDNGGYRCTTPSFTAVVYDDGSVDFRSPRKVELLPFPLNFKPLPLPANTPSLVGEVDRMLQGKSARQMRNIENVQPPPYPAYAPDPLELCSDSKSRCFADQRGVISVVTATGPLDVGDEILRMIGDDPAKVEKARFLAGTSALRTRIAERKRQKELKRALDDLPAMMNSIWRTPMLTRAERLDIVKGLLNDIAADAPGADNARAQIRAFIDKREAEAAAPRVR